MEKSYQMLLFDSAAHKIIHIDGLTGFITAETAYPPDVEPVDIAILDESLVYILAIKDATDKGVLFQYFTTGKKMPPEKRLRPLAIPDISPLQIAVDASTSRLIIACEDGSLYAWRNQALSLLGHTKQSAVCVGIQARSDAIYTIWEQKQGGIIALLSSQGELLGEYYLPGIPTHLAVTASGLLLVSYTWTTLTGEGVAIFETRNLKLAPVQAIPFNCPLQPIKTYPTFIAISPDETTCYIIHEDGGFISKIDLAEKKLVATWLIGHSISSLHFLPDSRFAMGPSRKFADLTLIDIHLGEPISITSNPERHLLGLLAILPISVSKK